jgi:trehalose 6-phosphate synthase/phosphatase
MEQKLSRTILVSNRLPVRVDASGRVSRTSGGLASALNGAGVTSKGLWVGWPGLATEAIADPQALRASMAAVNTAPVLLSQAELDGFYEGYSNATLWPVLHNQISQARFDGPTWFPVYEEVNRRFAEVVLAVAQDGDTIWIHDYHLFLLPDLLRRSNRDLRIGYFLHTPFPSSETFRALPERAALLTGLLGADLIGFHTYNYLRHFRSSVLRVLGVESEVDTVWHQGRELKLGVYPIGHDRRGFERARGSSAFRRSLDAYRSEIGKRSLILSVERLDYTKGVPEKLAAIREFLKRNPERHNVLFLLIAVPSREGVEAYDELTSRVQREVGAINGDFSSVGHSPVQFLHRGLPQAKLAALYALADVCLVLPLIDGMNLVAKEFIDGKRNAQGERPGCLILSEFAGAAQEMSHALIVNPYDVHEVLGAIGTALAMSDREKAHRTKVMQERLDRHDAGVWARRFLDDLPGTAGGELTGALMGSMQALASRLAETVRAGRSLALFLDYDGTLRSFELRPEEALPGVELCSLLTALAAVPGVSVAIVSGRPKAFLEEHLGGLGVTLVAEHGYRWLRPGQARWRVGHPRLDTSWMAHVRPHLEQSRDATPGTQIEEKRTAMVWHYRRADPEFGQWQARALLEDLTDITASLPVSVHHGKKIVEVASQFVSKGEAVTQLIDEIRPDCVLVAGDDQTDETMFALEPDGIEFHSFCVGNQSTRAGHRTTLAGLRALLDQLAANLSGSDPT